ncbi:hypothetical protein ASL11_03045 [Paenibacillus sp. Soil750]|nr:hypothetical protein ASL11_03045 [Paenibacillus sp. Soil750]
MLILAETLFTANLGDKRRTLTLIFHGLSLIPEKVIFAFLIDFSTKPKLKKRSEQDADQDS